MNDAYHLLGKIAPGDVGPFLDELRADLATYPREQAVAAIRNFLGSKRDRATNLPLAIGADGTLATAPSLRVWLLDELARIDLNHAAAMAEVILNCSKDPQEWAIALRDYARTRQNVEGAAFVKAKLRQLWNEPQWKQEQTRGWLAAFDLAPHLRATDLAPDLANLIVQSKGPAKPAQQAAFTALDRLTIVEPAGVLDQLQKNPDWLQRHEMMRADLFARADVRDAQQRSILEAYLLDPSRDPLELEKFAASFPNTSSVASETLITKLQPRSGEEVAAQQRASGAVLQEWIADARFDKLRPHLANIRARLEATSGGDGAKGL